jgi:hypothetical protein
MPEIGREGAAYLCAKSLELGAECLDLLVLLPGQRVGTGGRRGLLSRLLGRLLRCHQLHMYRT